MIRIDNHLGSIEISEHYFGKLIGNAVSSCFGVAGMANSNTKQGIRSIFKGKTEYLDQGVAVRSVGNGLVVDLHIVVTYGLNIAAIVSSITNKVSYVVEEATGLKVSKVNVFVDSMKTE